MIYIERNELADYDDVKAFFMYDINNFYTLEFTCTYDEMLRYLQSYLQELLDEKLITHEEAWNLRDDYVAYNELVENYNKK